ncbi:DNA polymerase III subunit delta [Roseiarcaceae bacterium H3SJ34-1]|uniref:DNA polymerase III subunit delta n=1 Tax=Terripilifer ovatus TaxID=3032367 RepID=UPI003AB93391|nr:DNA polymerase III subunit delta [Roseiarcaceae bacterium H3SJ34-1]
MVAIRSNEAERFLAKPQPQIRLYLFFGTDTGLVSERARSMLRQSVDDVKDPFQVVELDSSDLSADPQRLIDEANTVGLFGGRRAILVAAGAANIVGAFEPLIDDPPKDCTVIVEAGALRSDSALRKLFAQERFAAAIECLPDSEDDIARLVDAEVAQAGLKISEPARDMLVSLLGVDRLTTRAEIEKLILYTHGQTTIELDDVLNNSADASALVTDEAIDGAFAGNHEAVSETLERVFSSGTDAGGFLSQAMRHAVIAHRIRLEIDSGTSPDRALDMVTRSMPVPYPRKAPLLSHAKTWNAPRLNRAVAVIAEAIKRSRREAHLAPEIAIRALWMIALAGRSARR